VTFVGRLQCPRCGSAFRVGLSVPRRPTPADEFEVLCPINASRFRFRAIGGPAESWAAVVAELEEVAALPAGVAVAAAVGKRPGRTRRWTGRPPRAAAAGEPGRSAGGGLPRVTPVRDRSELVAATAQPRAFLFLWVNWAVHARNSRAVVEEVVASWQAEHPDQPVPCFVADVSDQCGELWDALAEWLTAEGRPAGQLMMSGAGPLIWVRSGHVVLHVPAPLQHGPAKLVAASRSAFAPDAVPGAAADPAARRDSRVDCP